MTESHDADHHGLAHYLTENPNSINAMFANCTTLTKLPSFPDATPLTSIPPFPPEMTDMEFIDWLDNASIEELERFGWLG